MEDIGKYRGCLIGGAVGDALGYPVEFMSVAAIKERFGVAGIMNIFSRMVLLRFLMIHR